MRELPSWYSDAACKKYPTHWWYMYDKLKDRFAKKICNTCPVKAECLQYALQNEETGVWGGLNDNDRRMLVRKFYVQEALTGSSRQKTRHGPLSPANGYPAYLAHISYPQTHNQPVLSKAAVLQAPIFPGLYTKSESSQ